jgi:hypothetical protein
MWGYTYDKASQTGSGSTLTPAQKDCNVVVKINGVTPTTPISALVSYK